METDLVISGLSRKRDEIDAKVREAERHIVALRSDRAVIAAAMLVFDPSRRPQKRATGRQSSGISRIILGVLRTASAALSVREIAERVETESGPYPDHEALTHNVRNTVARHNGKGLRREVREGVIVWSVE